MRRNGLQILGRARLWKRHRNLYSMKRQGIWQSLLKCFICGIMRSCCLTFIIMIFTRLYILWTEWQTIKLRARPIIWNPMILSWWAPMLSTDRKLTRVCLTSGISSICRKNFCLRAMSGAKAWDFVSRRRKDCRDGWHILHRRVTRGSWAAWCAWRKLRNRSKRTWMNFFFGVRSWNSWFCSTGMW